MTDVDLYYGRTSIDENGSQNMGSSVDFPRWVENEPEQLPCAPRPYYACFMFCISTVAWHSKELIVILQTPPKITGEALCMFSHWLNSHTHARHHYFQLDFGFKIGISYSLHANKELDRKVWEDFLSEDMDKSFYAWIAELAEHKLHELLALLEVLLCEDTVQRNPNYHLFDSKP